MRSNGELGAWVAFDKIWLSFTLPVSPEVAEGTTAVGVTLSRL